MNDKRELLAVVAEQVRDSARRELRERRDTARPTKQTKSDGSWVTAADLALQARLSTALAAVAADIPVLGEEMPAVHQRALLAAGGRCWVLDPLDGTSNYACGFPFVAVSLALIEAGTVQLGVVFDPFREECFTAILGHGAWLNGMPLAPYAPSEMLSDALALIDLKRLPPARLPALLGGGAFRSQRNLGAVALEWCWLAAGRGQLYLHGGQRLWDHAAGRLIATEAGAITALYARDGSVPPTSLDLEPRLALGAATPALFAQWQTHIGLPWVS